MSIAHLPSADDDTNRGRVAAEVRGHLAKRRIPVYKLSAYLGGDESRGYWQRRVSGELALDIDDLTRLAGLLDVSIVDLVQTTKTPEPPRPGGVGESLPDLDSNQEPADITSHPRFRPSEDDDTASGGTLAPVTAIGRAS